MKFRVEYVASFSHGSYVFARQLGAGDFCLGDHSRLGNVDIKSHLSQPRALKKNGEIDLTVFAFQPVNPADLGEFSEGQVVLLEE